ncbi:peptide ABC transporter permease [Kitasatospora phosalacinea]|uniref:Peptide ABC transporter permease n=1 Tax=Kitasatospora phosalacinea TaxID=2065 RepID=A0A9W6QA15_9ACTN|nr:ABC transporter permease [Kitasatospora phosalacinea]GLW72640.1 peptide ABC transporter permease [Kitasatospora phosalacinea]
MTRYLLRRLAHTAFVLWAAFTASFVLLFLLPGDPVATMVLGGGGSAALDGAQVAALRHAYGFDRPVPAQYLDRLLHALHGDFGSSVQSGERVGALIADALPQTAQLTGAALLLALLGGGALALAGAWTRSRRLARLLDAAPALGVSAPTFWTGLMLIQFVSFRLGLFPSVGAAGPAALVLPALTLALPAGAVLARVFTGSLRAALGEPYVTTARAKGATRARVYFGHALRNAAGAPLALLGLLVGELLAGSVVTETVFSRGGLGRVTASAVATQDIPVVQGLVVLGAAVFALANLAVDLAQPLVDPRLLVRTAAPRSVTA